MRKAIRLGTYLKLSVILIALLASVQIFNQPKGLAQECLNSSTTAGEVNYGESRCASNNELDWDKENMQTLLDKENEMIGANSSEVLYIEGARDHILGRFQAQAIRLKVAIPKLLLLNQMLPYILTRLHAGLRPLQLAMVAGILQLLKIFEDQVNG